MTRSLCGWLRTPACQASHIIGVPLCPDARGSRPCPQPFPSGPRLISFGADSQSPEVPGRPVLEGNPARPLLEIRAR